MESNELKKLVKDLYHSIAYHNYYYNYSDDHRVWSSSVAAENKIVNMIRTILKNSTDLESSLLSNCLKAAPKAEEIQSTIKSFFKSAKNK